MNRRFAAWAPRPRRNNRDVFGNAQDAHIQEAPNHQSKHKNESDNQGRALKASVRNVPHPVPTLNAGASPQCPMPNTRGSALMVSFRLAHDSGTTRGAPLRSRAKETTSATGAAGLLAWAGSAGL